jgi:hypothetical protein
LFWAARGSRSAAADMTSHQAEFEPQEPEFFRAAPGGKVHVYRHHTSVLPPEDSSWASLLTASVTSKLAGLCGTCSPVGERHYVEQFADEELCATCRKLWRGDPVALFEHEQ